MQCEPASPFSVRRAFVVQFRAGPEIEAQWITGRVEHIVSREATFFDSLEGLLSFIRRVLQQYGDAAADEV